MKNMKFILFSLLFFALMPSYSIEASDGENCSFSTYLVGYVDPNKDNHTIFQIINPTSQKLFILLGFFDQEGNPTGCKNADLLPNGMLQMAVSSQGMPDAKPPVAKGNVVKIVSLDRADGKPTRGIVGFQRHYYQTGFALWGTQRIYESNLATIPAVILQENGGAELTKIIGSCNP